MAPIRTRFPAFGKFCPSCSFSREPPGAAPATWARSSQDRALRPAAFPVVLGSSALREAAASAASRTPTATPEDAAGRSAPAPHRDRDRDRDSGSARAQAVGEMLEGGGAAPPSGPDRAAPAGGSPGGPRQKDAEDRKSFF